VSQTTEVVTGNNAGCGEDMDVKLVRLLESQPRPTTVQRTYTEEERRIREAILAQYSQVILQTHSIFSCCYNYYSCLLLYHKTELNVCSFRIQMQKIIPGFYALLLCPVSLCIVSPYAGVLSLIGFHVPQNVGSE
jgi:hypothetical protein